MKTKKRINVIDLLVVVVLVIAIAVFAASKIVGGDSVDGEIKKMRITFYSEEVSDSIAEAMKDGDAVSDSVIEVQFGNAKIDVEDSVSYIATDKNEYIKTTRSGFSSVTISCETEALYSDLGAVFDEYIYGIGHTLTLLVGDSRITARVSDIELLEE